MYICIYIIVDICSVCMYIGLCIGTIVYITIVFGYTLSQLSQRIFLAIFTNVIAASLASYVISEQMRCHDDLDRENKIMMASIQDTHTTYVLV